MMADTKILYHLSKEPVGLMFPQVPNSDIENQAIPRICFNDSIEGCLASINEDKDILGERFKVYSVVVDDYYVPTLSEAPARDITGEVWIQYAVEPDYLFDVEITGKASKEFVEISGDFFMRPKWSYKKINDQESLQEDTRSILVSKSRSVGPYKDQMRGKNRFERKKHSKIATTVQQYNKIDMNKFFKQDILEVSIPVVGETDSYTVQVRMEGVVTEIARNIKSNKNKLEFRTVVQSITKVFNTANIFVKCSCPDYKYRFAHWNIINRVSIDDTSKDPGPGKGIRNPNDSLGRGCKHVLLVLANGDWVMKVASVINNYINYAEKNMQKPFLKLIFPKLYGVPYDEATDNDLLPEDFELDSSTSIIDTINDYGRNRGKYKPGTNKNPVTGTGGRQKATEPATKEKAPEAKKTSPETPSKEAAKSDEQEKEEEANKKPVDKKEAPKDEENSND